MSDLYEKNEMKDNIVKLRVNGASRVVNTIEEQRTAKGLSLVCPFPSLEVEIPIRFTNAKGEECEGCIHRIGVEDDPETGLPKLRLAVRSESGDRETVVKTPTAELLKEASVMTMVPSEVLAEAAAYAAQTGEHEVEIVVDFPEEEAPVSAMPTDADNVDSMELMKSISQSHELDAEPHTLLNSLFDELEDTATSELLSLEELGSEKKNKSRTRDPEWVCYSDMPIPGELLEKAHTRRRRRAIAVAAWMMVLGIAVGGVYVLGKAGVVDVASAKQYVAALNGESANASASDSFASLSMKENSAEADANAQSNTVVSEAREMAAVEPEAVNAAENSSVEPAPADIEEEAAMVEEGLAMNGEEAQSSADVAGTEIVLPTRWPAEFATAYRLQNPNGVVVDIPGGLVKKEGWLNIGENDEIIRSIKAVQRENGARFIVYVKGNLPNFKTAPKSGGIRLSLYYGDADNSSSETQQVAMLAQ